MIVSLAEYSGFMNFSDQTGVFTRQRNQLQDVIDHTNDYLQKRIKFVAITNDLYITSIEELLSIFVDSNSINFPPLF